MSRKTPEPDGQRELKKRVFNNLLKKVSTRMELWKDSRVKEGGKIVVTSGRRDDMTKSYKANESFLENPQVTVVDVKRGTHMTPLLNANNIIEAVSKAQEPGAPRKVSF